MTFTVGQKILVKKDDWPYLWRCTEANDKEATFHHRVSCDICANGLVAVCFTEEGDPYEQCVKCGKEFV